LCSSTGSLTGLCLPLQPRERVLRTRKKKSLGPHIDRDYLDWAIPARSNSSLLDQLTASKAALKEPEFQNDSEDDEREYLRDGRR